MQTHISQCERVWGIVQTPAQLLMSHVEQTGYPYTYYTYVNQGHRCELYTSLYISQSFMHIITCIQGHGILMDKITVKFASPQTMNIITPTQYVISLVPIFRPYFQFTNWLKHIYSYAHQISMEDMAVYVQNILLCVQLLPPYSGSS